MPRSSLNPAYLGGRPDVLAMLSAPPKRSLETPRRVLDVGCSAGALGHCLKQAGHAEVVGLELLPEAAARAAGVLDEVLVGDAESLFRRGALDGRRFDAIIMADVLEHLRDPWWVLEKTAELLAPGGEVVASLPNVRHYTTLFNLAVLGRWPYRERGIHDRTHLRFFTRRNIEELFTGADLVIERVDTIYRFVETPHRLNDIARFFAWPGLRGFLAFQYLVRARRPGGAEHRSALSIRP